MNFWNLTGRQLQFCQGRYSNGWQNFTILFFGQKWNSHTDGSAKGSHRRVYRYQFKFHPLQVKYSFLFESSSIWLNWYSDIHFRSGIFDDDTCKNGTVNHGVLIVGYGRTNSTDYWIVRNSWGTSWGMSGYIFMKRNVNICRIAEYAFLATI